MKFNLKILLLYLLTLSIPFYGFSFINIGERPFLRPTWFFGGFLIIVFLLGVCLKKQKIKMNIVGKAVLTLNLIAILSSVNLFSAKNSQIIDFFTKWIQLVFCSLLFFAVSNLRINKEQIRNVFRIWIFTAFFVSLYAIYQSIGRNLNLHFPLTYFTPEEHFLAASRMLSGTFGSFARCSSFFSEPSFLGSYLIAPILFLSITLVYKPKKFVIFKRGNVKWLLFFTMICAFLLCFSLASYITLAIMYFFIFLNKKSRGKSFKIGLITLVIIFSIILGLRYLNVDFLSGFSRVKYEYTRFILEQSISTGSIRQRLIHSLRALKIWKDHPFLGVGINNVPYYHGSYSPPDWLRGGLIEEGGGGNMWSMALGEMGIVGFGGLIFLWISALLKMRRCVRLTQNSSLFFLPLVFYYILLGEVVNSFFTHQFIHVQRWFYLSLTVWVMFYINSTIDLKGKDVKVH